MSTDAELLRSYASDHAETAFTEFVRRNLGLVYGAALRRAGGRSHLAEEISQRVFCDAARKASALARHPSLAGWLHQSTRYAAIDAARAEQRRSRLAQTLAAMHNPSLDEPPSPDWEKLRPILDEALDELGDKDRELVLLRHFQGLPHAEVGRRLGLNENTARKRGDRALEHLRARLTRRGICSTGAALGLLLSGAPLSAAPATLVQSLAGVAVATPPASALSALFTLIVMNKITAPFVGAALAAGLTTAVWSASHQDLSKEISAEQDDYARLRAATGPGASAEDLARVAKDYERGAGLLAGHFARRAGAAAGTGAQAAPGGAQPVADEELSPHGYSNRGRATSQDAMLSFAWACDLCDPEQLASMVYLEQPVRARAAEVLAGMPEAVRRQYPTPEAFYGFLLAAACLEAPPPNAEIALRLFSLVELGPDRAASRRIGSERNMHEFQRTENGWKYVLPAVAVDSLPKLLSSPTLTALARKP